MTFGFGWCCQVFFFEAAWSTNHPLLPPRWEEWMSCWNLSHNVWKPSGYNQSLRVWIFQRVIWWARGGKELRSKQRGLRPSYIGVWIVWSLWGRAKSWPREGLLSNGVSRMSATSDQRSRCLGAFSSPPYLGCGLLAWKVGVVLPGKWLHHPICWGGWG